MVEQVVAPSELHLKKELTALRKARFLRDPETCSSWRFLRDPEACSSRGSHLSFKSVSAYHFLHDNEIRRISTRESTSSRLLEIHHRHEKTSKKAHLCNWKPLSSISGELDVNLVDDDGNQLSAESCFEDNICTFEKEDTEHNKRFNKSSICKDGCRETPKKSKKTSNANKVHVKPSSAKKHMDLPISTMGVPSSIEQSDDTEYCNSENAQDIDLDLLCKTIYQSPSLSPLLSGSECSNWPRTSKLFSSIRRERSPLSCTPASTNSLYRKIGWKSSTIGSCRATADSSEEDDFDHLDLPVRQGCGLPCYKSILRRDSSFRDYFYPPLSDTTRKKGGNFFGESQVLSNKPMINGFNMSKVASSSPKSLPLLTEKCDETSSGELSANLRELDLESLSRLDGIRWSSSKIQGAFDLPKSGTSSVGNTYNKNSDLMHNPKIFDQIIGQNIVVQSLKNAILRGKIAPAYLFHGSPGTGKKSIARIFATALTCVGTTGNKPCQVCKECEQKSSVREANAANTESIETVNDYFQNMTLKARKSRYAIFIIDECHLLTSKMWSKFLRFLEEPFYHTIFIFVTVDIRQLPRAILSRTQKYHLAKIKEADILWQLKKLSATKNLDIDMDALNAIAVHADGSLKNAETMHYQLSLLEKRITTTLVNDLVGIIPDEKLLDLLEVAMSSNTTETVRRSIELMDSGVEPMSLIAQLVGLIMDIIAGTKQLADSKYDVAFEEQSLTEDELKRLEHAVRILSDAEKQFKHSTEHSSLLTTALLQLASVNNMHSTLRKCIGKQHNTAKMNDSIEECFESLNRSENLLELQESSSVIVSNYNATQGPLSLYEIWRRCIENCHSKALKQIIFVHGNLVSLTVQEGTLIAFIAFSDNNVKLRAERYSSCMAKLLKMVLKQNVHVKMDLILDSKLNFEPLPDSRAGWRTGEFHDNHGDRVPNAMRSSPYRDNNSFPCKDKETFEGAGLKKLEKCCSSLPHEDDFHSESSSISSEKQNESVAMKEREIKTAVLKLHCEPFNDQTLENACMQTENGRDGKLFYQSPAIIDKSLKHWEDVGKNVDIKIFELCAIHAQNRLPDYEDRINGTVSPSLLHSNNFGANSDKEILEVESTKRCSGLLCWKTSRPHRKKVKLGAHPRFQKARHILLCGQQMKSKFRGVISSR